MHREAERLFGSIAMAFIGMLCLTDIAQADPPIWAWANGVKATDTVCGDVHFLVLRGIGVKAPAQSATPGCKSSEVTFQHLLVAKGFFAGQKNVRISAPLANAVHFNCVKGVSNLILGRSAADAERARRSLGPTPDCSYKVYRYQLVSSLGDIPFKDSPNPGTMSVAESLAMHAKERQQIIAECNANPACRAEVARMRSQQATGSADNPCIANGAFSQYNGAGRCTDSNGNADPKGGFVSPR